MCFSAEADLITGVVITGVGVEGMRHVRHRRQLSLALLPLLFGAHQIIETLVWWSLEGRISAAVGERATTVYLVIAFVLPIIVPLAMVSLERDRVRRLATGGFAVLGAVVSVVLLVEMFAGPVSATIEGRYIAYHVSLTYGGQITALYVVATCGPLLLSSRPFMKLFGALNLIAVGVLATLMTAGVISLWCAWEAVVSVVIVIHLRTAEEKEEAEALAAAV